MVGIEIPNETRNGMSKEVLTSDAYDVSSILTLALGNDIAGVPVVATC